MIAVWSLIIVFSLNGHPEKIQQQVVNKDLCQYVISDLMKQLTDGNAMVVIAGCYDVAGTGHQ